MALSEIQKDWLTKAELYRRLLQINTDIDSIFKRLENQVEFLDLISGQDLTDISVPGAAQSLLLTMRTALNALIANYNSNYAAIADQLRMIG